MQIFHTNAYTKRAFELMKIVSNQCYYVSSFADDDERIFNNLCKNPFFCDIQCDSFRDHTYGNYSTWLALDHYAYIDPDGEITFHCDRCINDVYKDAIKKVPGESCSVERFIRSLDVAYEWANNLIVKEKFDLAPFTVYEKGEWVEYDPRDGFIWILKALQGDISREEYNSDGYKKFIGTPLDPFQQGHLNNLLNDFDLIAELIKYNNLAYDKNSHSFIYDEDEFLPKLICPDVFKKTLDKVSEMNDRNISMSEKFFVEEVLDYSFYAVTDVLG